MSGHFQPTGKKNHNMAPEHCAIPATYAGLPLLSGQLGLPSSYCPSFAIPFEPVGAITLLVSVVFNIVFSSLRIQSQ